MTPEPTSSQKNSPKAGSPIVVSTWAHGVPVNKAALAQLAQGGTALDAVEAGVAVSEADPSVTSVGYGGSPNAEGIMQLDAAIMDGRSLNAGAVGALERVLHPIRVARKVMEETPHVMLVGDGARKFALTQGFTEQDLLSESAKARYEKWRASKSAPRVPGHRDSERSRPLGDRDDHDTVGAVALDGAGEMAAACTTSGMSWKVPGRVGDSPIIGAGVYCDTEVGGVTATGVGEELIKLCGSFLTVELMRQGRSPQEAVEEVLRRAIRRNPENQGRLLALAALRRDGEWGAASTVPGFQVAIGRRTGDGEDQHELLDGKVFKL